MVDLGWRYNLIRPVKSQGRQAEKEHIRWAEKYEYQVGDKRALKMGSMLSTFKQQITFVCGQFVVLDSQSELVKGVVEHA